MSVVPAGTVPVCAATRLGDIQDQLEEVSDEVQQLQIDTRQAGDSLRRELADTFDEVRQEVSGVADQQARALASLSRLNDHLREIDQQLAAFERRATALEEEVAGLKKSLGSDEGGVAALRREMNQRYNELAKKLRQSVEQTNRTLRQLAEGQPVTPAADSSDLPIAGTYKVQPGDTLRAIAVSFGTSVERIMQANNITNANHIQVGQELKIPEPAQ